LNIRNDSWLENIVEISSWTFMKDLSNWRMPLDDSNFTTVPTDVNAFYTFQDNAISKFKI
jgi:predicted metalloendopeptidase